MSRGLYTIILAFSFMAALWCIVLYQATPAVFSDIEIFGIKHGEDAYTTVVETAQRQIFAICTPLAVLLVIALMGWGNCVRDNHRKKSGDAGQASDAT